MKSIRKIYNWKLVITAIVLLILSSCFFIVGCIKNNTPGLSENKLLNIKGIFVDNEGFLYISTNDGILVYGDNFCVGAIEVGTSIRIAVDSDIVYIWDYATQKMYYYRRNGELAKDNRADVYPIEQFQQSSYTKNGSSYNIHRILGYSYITVDGKTLYHSPVVGYLGNISMFIAIPSFIYLGFGWVVVYGIWGGRDKMIKSYYKEAFKELFRK